MQNKHKNRLHTAVWGRFFAKLCAKGDAFRRIYPCVREPFAPPVFCRRRRGRRPRRPAITDAPVGVDAHIDPLCDIPYAEPYRAVGRGALTPPWQGLSRFQRTAVEAYSLLLPPADPFSGRGKGAKSRFLRNLISPRNSPAAADSSSHSHRLSKQGTPTRRPS